MDQDQLLLMPEVSAITRLSVDTLRYMRHAGGGPPSFRLGRRVMYRRSEVLDWIARQARQDANAVQAARPA